MKRVACSLMVGACAAMAGAWAPPALWSAAMTLNSSPMAVMTVAGTNTVVAGAPMIEITKTCPKLRYLGRDATFEITVSNKGNAAAANVVVTDVITGSLDFTSADNGGVREGSNIVWRLGTLDAGATKTLKVMAKCNTIGTVKNTATVTYCSESVAACEMEVKGIPAILLECVDDPDPIEINGQLTYTITVTNQGTSTGTNIVVECTLPDEEEFVKAAGATQGTSEGKNLKFAPLPTLAPKARAVYTVTVKGIKAADARFKIQMKSDQTETPVMETESSHIYD